MLTRRDVLHHIEAAGVTAAALHSNLARADMPPNKTTPNFAVPAAPATATFTYSIQRNSLLRKSAPTRRRAVQWKSSEALHKSLQIGRVVVVSRASDAADNSATLDAIRRMGPARARGVAVIDKSTSAGAIDEMHAAGIRGVRTESEHQCRRQV